MAEKEDPNQRIVKSANEARGATERPRTMPMVLIISTLAAFIVCLIAYLLYFQ